MTEAKLLVNKLTKLGIRVYLDDGKLKTQSRKGAITPTLGELIKHNRETLIDFLSLQEQTSLGQVLIPKHNLDNQSIPTSFSQQRLWFIDALEGGSEHYNMPGAILVEGYFQPLVAEEAFRQIIQRHEALRTVFLKRKGEPVQVIKEQVDFKIPVHVIHNQTKDKQQEYIKQFIDKDMLKAFNLAEDLPIRVTFIQRKDDLGILVFNIHHIAFDGWSIDLLFSEFSLIYTALIEGRSPELPLVELQYSDYAVWQRDNIDSCAMHDKLDYWKKHLKALPEVHSIPLDFPRSKTQSHNGGVVSLVIESDILAKLKLIGQQANVTTFMLLHAVFYCVLSKFSNTKDIVIGTPVANRPHNALEKVIGFFVNTLVLRVNHDDDSSFLELLDIVKKVNLNALANQDVPFEKVVDKINPQRNSAYNSLFQVLLMISGNRIPEINIPELKLTQIKNRNLPAKFDLTINAVEDDSGLEVLFEFNCEIFHRRSIKRLADSTRRLVDAVVEQPEIPMSEINLCDSALLSNKSNDKPRKESGDSSICDLVEFQAKENPQQLALSFGDKNISYKELNCRANQLAHYFIAKKHDLVSEQQVSVQSTLAICGERSIETIIGVLAILKAGHVYLPIDTNLPSARINGILNDSKTVCLLATEKCISQFEESEREVANLERLLASPEILNQRTSNPERANFDDAQLAYLLYTSGSTGKPKGVLQTHKTLINLVKSQGLTKKLVTLQFAPLNFDVSIQEMTTSWYSGSPLVLIDEETKANLSDFAHILEENKIERLFCPPAVLNWLAELCVKSSKQLPQLKEIISAGEALIFNQYLHAFAKTHKSCRIWNHYGPTETHVATTYLVDNLTAKLGQPIGRLLNGVVGYIVDESKKLVPAGGIGELAIGGKGLAQGYVNNPELTNERFILNPFGPGRIYLTGDLVRLNHNDQLVFIGRNDRQVQVRGFRIELDEIEKILLQNQLLVCVSVQLIEVKQEVHLVAFFTVKEGQEATQDLSLELKRYLKFYLPTYMVPSFFKCIDTIPLTKNGKVDVRRLPIIESIEETTYSPPKTKAEKQLSYIWADLLSVDINIIGCDSDFFEIGGHSLLAVKLIASLREKLGIDLKLQVVFDNSNLSDMASMVEHADKSSLQKIIPVTHSQVDLPLSYAQQRIWFIEQLEGDSIQYNMPGAFTVTGEINVRGIEEALVKVVSRQQSLRTVIKQTSTGAVQIVNSEFDFKVSEVDLCDVDKSQQRSKAREICLEDANKSFNLEQDLMLRVSYLKFSNESGVLFFNVHHIASDGWSVAIFIEEFVNFYATAIKGEVEVKLDPLEVQYTDYALWQREWLEGESVSKQLDYWQKKLEELPQVHNLPLDYTRPKHQTFYGERLAIEFPLTTISKLQTLAKAKRATLFMVIHAAFTWILARYSNTSDIVIGTPVANRLQSELKPLVGFFVNTLVLRTDTGKCTSFTELLELIKRTNLEAQENQEIPFEHLVDNLNPERSTSYNSLFQILLNMNNNEVKEISLPGMKFEEFDLEHCLSKFDLTLNVDAKTNYTKFEFVFNRSLFRRSTVSRMAKGFESFINALVLDSERPLFSYPIMSKNDRAFLLSSLNRNSVDYPKEKFIHQLFERQAKKTPDKTALIFESEHLSYCELERSANRLARLLTDKGVENNGIVGVCIEPSIDLMVTLLGILKIGAAYLPLDPKHPPKRLQEIIDDSQLKFLVTRVTESASLPNNNLNVITLDQPDIAEQLKQSDSNPLPLVESVNSIIAYVIYTSGSTGKPKGVSVSHRSVVNYLESIVPFCFDIDGSIVVTNICFDGTITSLLPPLMAGKFVRLIPENDRKFNALSLALKDDKNRYLFKLTPSFLTATREFFSEAVHKARHIVFSGGESLAIESIKDWKSLLPNTQWINHYGPTEATVGCSIYPITLKSLNQVNSNSVPIGKALQNVEFYILDKNQLPVPFGTTGELYIGGDCLARGYLHNKTLTQTRFIENPFSDLSDSRMYRTGDLVRYLQDSSLEFVGRIDHQVKIRGFRIELGEIEHQLSMAQEVESCIVVVNEQPNIQPKLVAYFTSYSALSQEKLSIRLRDYMQKRLPSYMVPSLFCLLEKMPLNQNGKVNRRLLPTPDFKLIKSEYIAPSTNEEKVLCSIWENLLGIPAGSLSITSNFFELGGDSISSIQVVSRAMEIGLRLTVKQIFEYQTIQLLAPVVEQENKVLAPQQALTGALKLLPIQHKFFENKVSLDHYNQAFIYLLPKGFQFSQLSDFIYHLYIRHDSLRLRFDVCDNVVRAEYKALTQDMVTQTIAKVDLPEDDFSGIVEEANRIHRSLSIQNGPLIKAVFFENRLGQKRLLLSIHHLVVDGVSWRILTDDLNRLYQQVLNSEDLCLGTKSSSFQQWSEYLHRIGGEELIKSDKQYWVDTVSKRDNEPFSVSPTKAGPPNYASEQFYLDKATTRLFIGEAQAAYKTQINELLLSALLLGWYRITGMQEISIDMEGHGRADLDPDMDLSQTIGWFTTIYPINLVSESMEYADLICRIKEACRVVPHQGISYGILKYLAAVPELVLAEESTVLFNYLGQLTNKTAQQKNSEDLFILTNEDPGNYASTDRTPSHHLLFNGAVLDGRLGFRVKYNKRKYDRDFVVNLTRSFKKSLETICRHCVQDGVGRFSPSDFPLADIAPNQLEQWQQTYNIENIYPATSMQQGLLFHSEIDKSAYVTQLLFTLPEHVDITSFQKAWLTTVERHAVLRTSFMHQAHGEIQQLVQRQVGLDWDEFDLSNDDESCQHKKIELFRKKDKALGFVTSKAPLLRFTLWNLGKSGHRVLMTNHHALFDGWSRSIIFSEVQALYAIYSNHKDESLPPPSNYLSYPQWLAAQDTELAWDFWKSELCDIEGPTLISDKQNNQNNKDIALNSKLVECCVGLDERETAHLVSLARECQVTINTLLQAAWSILLSRYSNHSSIVFGTTVSGRPATLKNVDKMVGLFINTVPVRVDIDKDLVLSKWYKSLQDRQAERELYCYLPLNKIQRLVESSHSADLIDSLLIFENYPFDESTFDSSSNSVLPTCDLISFEQTNFNLTVTAYLNEQLNIKLTSQQHLFSQSKLSRMSSHLLYLLLNMSKGASTTIEHLPMLSTEELGFLLAPVQESLTHTNDIFDLKNMFESQTKFTPDNKAVIYADKSLSYKQLNTQANRLANHLISIGVTENSVVGLYLERSIEMLIAVLAVVKTGATYLPLEPSLPNGRIKFMIEDSGARVVLAQSEAIESLETQNIHILNLNDIELKQNLLVQSPDNPAYKAVKDSDSVYIIYTSGSTGKPKGVVITHRGLFNYLQHAKSNYLNDHIIGSVVSSPLSFDATVTSLFTPLVVGKSVDLLVGNSMQNLADKIIRSTKPLLFKITPAHLDALMHVQNIRLSSKVEHIIVVGGEQLSKKTLAQWKGRILTNATFVNEYGPTEAVVGCSTFTINDKSQLDKIKTDSVPIGMAIRNTKLLVLANDLSPMPKGGIGELYIGGDGVAKGYVGREELTNKKFVTVNFSGLPPQRFYRSGDRVKYLDDGNLEFVGRNDDQIKVRGFRIELGEIENQLLALPEVDAAVVLLRKDRASQAQLIGYVEVRGHENDSLLTEKIKSYLATQLPEYMIPAMLICIDKMPLTTNGKIDKNSLPHPDIQLETNKYIAPKNEIENNLVNVWSDVLQIPANKISTDANFFELGGDSILSIQAVSRAAEVNVRLSVKLLFDYQTVATLAPKVEQSKVFHIDQFEMVGEQTLLPIQHFFFENKEGVHHYNHAILLDTPKDFSIEMLRDFCRHLYQRHDCLRMRFHRIQQDWQATYHSFTETMLEQSLHRVSLAEQDFCKLSLHADKFHSSLCLQKGPLFSAVLFTNARQQSRLLLIVHHLLVDGVSWRIIIEDFERLYLQRKKQQKLSLAGKTHSFQSWGNFLLDLSNSKEIKQEISYWNKIVNRSYADNSHRIKEAKSYRGTAECRFELDTVITDSLLKQAPAAYRTQVNELLLSALLLGYFHWCGQKTVRIDLESHGRHELSSDFDLSQTVGWFTSIFPMALETDAMELSQLICYVKETYRTVPNHGLGFGLLKYLSQSEELEGCENSTILFNYLGQINSNSSKDSAFTIASGDVGQCIDSNRQVSHEISISGMVMDGRLAFRTTYVKSRYSTESIEALSKAFEQAIKNIVHHCLSADAGRLTPSDFPLCRLEQSEIDSWQQDFAVEDIYPATAMQQGMLYHSILEPSAYVTQVMLSLGGDTNISAFKQAWQLVIARNSVLRTAFVSSQDGQMQQLIERSVELPWQQDDLSGITEQARQAQIESYRLSDRTLGFNIECAPLIRFKLWQLSDDGYQLLITNHHVLWDGWSSALIFKEVESCYNSIVNSLPVELSPPVDYAQYITWLDCQDKNQAVSFWSQELAGLDGPSVISHPKSQRQGFVNHVLQISELDSKRLRELSNKYQVTLNTIFQAAWSYLLSRYTDHQDIIFGTTVSGRPAELDSVESMIGLFINTLPVRVNVEYQQSLFNWLNQLHGKQVVREQFAYLSLADIQKLTNLEQDTQLLDSLLVFENYPVAERSSVPDGSPKLAISSIKGYEESNYNLSVIITTHNAIAIKLVGKQDRYTEAKLTQVGEHLSNVLTSLLHSESSQVDDLSLLTKLQQKQLVDTISSHNQQISPSCLHQLFEQQVVQSPNAIAAIFEDESITYQQLNYRSNKLAYALVELGVLTDELVGVCVERSIDMIVAVLGILKSGAAYLPLDPNYPQTRLDYMINDSEVEIVVTEVHLKKLFEKQQSRTIEIDLLLASQNNSNKQLPNPVISNLSSDKLAYAIYTSGSTGNPKCVLLEHLGAVNLANFQREFFGIDANDRVLHFASLNFDGATWEWIMALTTGAPLYLCNEETRKNPSALEAFLVTQKITHLALPPAVLSHLDETRDYSFKALIVAGEALKPDLSRKWNHLYSLYNAYGPSESTVCATISQPLKGEQNNIGKQLSNVELYVLDKQQNIQPNGLVGELYIGGKGLARGYYNRPELTKSRFIQNPFKQNPSRLYRTGDLVRRLDNGCFEFVGRNDHQVKIRGFRVELGEVEQQLSVIENVENVAVSVQSNGNSLVAFVEYERKVNLEEFKQQLINELGENLPDYMVPLKYIFLDKLPLTPNGKVDREQLVVPDKNYQSENFVQPNGDVAIALSHLWAELLTIPQETISANNNFFELGGHSLLTMKLITKMKTAFGLSLDIQAVFNLPTLSKLASHIEQLKSATQKSTNNEQQDTEHFEI